MPTTCGFPNCKFRSRYRGQEDNRHFYRIPKRPPQLRQRWLNAIGRTEETVVSQLRICSAHFAGGEKKEGDIPVPDPQFDPPLFISLPPRGETLRYDNAEQRQQRLYTKRMKVPKNQPNANDVKNSNKRHNERISQPESSGEKDFSVRSCSPILESKRQRGFANGKCIKFVGIPSNNVSPCLFLQEPQERHLLNHQQHHFVPFLNFLGMNRPRVSAFQHSSGTSTTSAPTPLSSNATRPLVALLDGRDCSVEMPLLKDVATVAFCDAQSTVEIHEKVLNEAVAAFLYHSITLSREDLLKFKALKVVVRIGSSFHNVDVNAATELGVAICNTPVECVEETADSTMLMILNMYRKTFWLSRICQNGGRQSPNVEQLRELANGCTRIRGNILGIIGLGRTGMSVALRARVFGFRVIFYDPYISTGLDKALDIERCDTLLDLLKRSDCVSMHCPLNADTRFMINSDSILKLKYGARIVNTSAAELIVATALFSALKSGHVRAAALDVYERNFSSNAEAEIAAFEMLCQMPNVICTPYCAWYSDESSKELRIAAAKEIRRALVGRFPEDLINCVNKEALLTRMSAMNGLIPASAPSIQELAAVFGLSNNSSATLSNPSLNRANLATILNQTDRLPSRAGNFFSSTSKSINGAQGNSGIVPKYSSNNSNSTNSLLLSGIQVPGLIPPTASTDNVDMMEQLNNLMTHFGSIPAEALNNLAAISSSVDMNASGNPATEPMNNPNYQNFLMSLNQQMLLNTSQSILSNVSNSNSHNSTAIQQQGNSAQFSTPTTTYDMTMPPFAATSSATITTCGDGSGRSSVSQNSAAGSVFDLQMTQNRIGTVLTGVKRKETNSPSLSTIPAKILNTNTNNISSIPSSALTGNDNSANNNELETDNNQSGNAVSENAANLQSSIDRNESIKNEATIENSEEHLPNQEVDNSANINDQSALLGEIKETFNGAK